MLTFKQNKENDILSSLEIIFYSKYVCHLKFHQFVSIVSFNEANKISHHNGGHGQIANPEFSFQNR